MKFILFNVLIMLACSVRCMEVSDDKDVESRCSEYHALLNKLKAKRSVDFWKSGLQYVYMNPILFDSKNSKQDTPDEHIVDDQSLFNDALVKPSQDMPDSVLSEDDGSLVNTNSHLKYLCHLCLFVSKTAHAAAKHWTREHKQYPIICPMENCNIFLPFAVDLIIHLKKTHPRSDYDYLDYLQKDSKAQWYQSAVPLPVEEKRVKTVINEIVDLRKKAAEEFINLSRCLTNN